MRFQSPLSVVTILIVASLVVYGAFLASSQPGPVTSVVPTKFSVDNRVFTFTFVATTQAEREHGLMNTKITNSTTMLFAFPSSQQWQFYMYDTNTSLDMVWVNATGSAGRVVYVVQAAQPCYTLGLCPKFTPSSPANYVIEAKAGFASANGITVGSEVQFS